MAGGYALAAHGGSPVITNNLLRGAVCFAELPGRGADDVDPLSFQNNAMVGCTTAYLEAHGAPGNPSSTSVAHTTSAAIDGLSGQPCLEEAGTLVRFSGNIASGGKDALGNDCGSGAMACGGEAIDARGAPRTRVVVDRRLRNGLNAGLRGVAGAAISAAGTRP